MFEFVNIITEDESKAWILRRCAREIQKKYPEITINGSPRPLTYVINYALHKNASGVTVGHYTHLEESGVFRKRFIDTIPLFDYYVAMCKKTAGLLLEHGADPRRVSVVRQGCDERVRKEPVFGIVGRTYPSGRKGEHLVEKMIASNYKIKAWGRGWNVDDTISDFDALPDFYRGIDYLVVTSLNEGGPIPVIDAIAAGVPVIAPDVGWCFEFPVIRYDVGDWESLNGVLMRLTNPPTWDSWAKAHGKIFHAIGRKEGLI